MKTPFFALVAAVALAMIPTLPVDAQVRGSERSRISQTVDGTTITVDYGRPRARGREPIFGNVVDWGHLWTPGANWATTLELSKDVEINGVSVPQGEYSLWMIADPEEWGIVLDPRDSIFHTMRPELTDQQIRISATPRDVPHVEALTFSFPEIRSDGVELLFAWGTMSVPMHVTVQPSQTLTMEADAAAPYPGVYDVKWVRPRVEPIPEGERPNVDSRLELTFADDHLTGIWRAFSQEDIEVMMVPVTGSVFHVGWMQDGELFETEIDLWVEFTVENGVATGFQIRSGIDDVLMWEGTRADSSQD